MGNFTGSGGDGTPARIVVKIIVTPEKKNIWLPVDTNRRENFSPHACTNAYLPIIPIFRYGNIFAALGDRSLPWHRDPDDGAVPHGVRYQFFLGLLPSTFLPVSGIISLFNRIALPHGRGYFPHCLLCESAAKTLGNSFGTQIYLPGHLRLRTRVPGNAGDLAVPAGRFGDLWHPAPERSLDHPLPALLPVREIQYPLMACLCPGRVDHIRSKRTLCSAAPWHHAPLFTSVDYTPLFPWSGMAWLGMGIGHYLYIGGIRQFSLLPLPDVLVKPLSRLGRHSLVICLVHQPTIVVLLALTTGMKIV